MTESRNLSHHVSPHLAIYLYSSFKCVFIWNDLRVATRTAGAKIGLFAPNNRHYFLV